LFNSRAKAEVAAATRSAAVTKRRTISHPPRLM
jgi:hypothetical protein